MSETKNTQENETKSDVPEEAEQALSELVRRYWSKPGTYDTPADERLRYEILINLITLYKDVLDKRVHATPADERLLREALTNLMTGHKEGPYEESDFNEALNEALFELLLRTVAKYELVGEHSEANWKKLANLTLNVLIHGRSTDEPLRVRSMESEARFLRLTDQIQITDRIQIVRSLVSEEEPIKIQLRIIEEPLTPQNLALILTALTELTTKLWLIEKHRFADLIEYTQTHDIRFANEAGTVITRVSYNSPFNFDWKVDFSAPSVAEAVMTVVDGLTQRKAHHEQSELENQEKAHKIKEAEQKLKQKQELAPLEREKKELELEKQRLENEKERQALVERRLEMQKKQFVDALELAGKAVDIVYPNADADMRPLLIQTVMNNILQLLSATGLDLILILPENKDEDNPKEDVEQT